MVNKWSVVISAVLLGWYKIRRILDELSKLVEPLILEVEKMAFDGVIDKAERKTLVMKAIALLEKQGKIKLNFITRITISKIVDKIATKLPDFKVSQDVAKIINQAKNS